MDLVLQQTEMVAEEWARVDLGNRIEAAVFRPWLRRPTVALLISSADRSGRHGHLDGIAAGPVGALTRDRGILRDHGAPHPTESAAPRGARVVGAVGALVRPAPERHPLPP
jgi:hypothetical protein